MMVSANSASCTPAEPTVAGAERAEELPHIGVKFGPAQRGEHADAPSIAADQQCLQHAGDQHAPGRGMAGGREEDGEQQRHDDRQVEQDRRRGRRGKTLQGIEDAAIERDQRDQQADRER